MRCRPSRDAQVCGSHQDGIPDDAVLMEPSDGLQEVLPGDRHRFWSVHLDDVALVQQVARLVSEAASARRVRPACACHWAFHRDGSELLVALVVVRPHYCRRVGSACRLIQGCCVRPEHRRFVSEHPGDPDVSEHQGVLSQLLPDVWGLLVARIILVFGRLFQHQGRQAVAVAVCLRVRNAASDASDCLL